MRFNIAHNGYKFDKLIFFSAFAIMLITFLILLNHYGIADKPYLRCDADFCDNPFAPNDNIMLGPVKSCPGLYCPPVTCQEDWCNEKVVSRGEYGTKNNIKNYFWFFALGLLFVSFTLNHIIHNRGNKFAIPLERKIFPNWIAAIIKKIYPPFNNTINLKSEVDEEEIKK